MDCSHSQPFLEHKWVRGIALTFLAFQDPRVKFNTVSSVPESDLAFLGEDTRAVGPRELPTCAALSRQKLPGSSAGPGLSGAPSRAAAGLHGSS